MGPEEYGIHGPLNLIWLAGNGQIEKLKKIKYREKVQKVNIFEAKALILKYTPTQNNTVDKTLGMKKISILVTGLVIINELQVDCLCKKVEALYHKLTQPGGAASPGIDIELSKNNILPQIKSGNLNLTFENEMGFRYFDMNLDDFDLFTERKVTLLPIDKSFLSTRHSKLHDLSNAQMVTEMEMDFNTTTIHNGSRRTAKDAGGKQHSKSKRMRTESYEEFPSQDDILEQLMEQAKTLNPFAHTILDPTLPPQPAIEGTDFCDVGEIEDPRLLLSLQSINNIRGEVQLSLLGPEILPDNLPSSLKNVVTEEPEYEQSETAKKTQTRTSRKKMHNSPLRDEKIEISDEDMRSQILLHSNTCLKTKSKKMIRRMPDVIRHAMFLDMVNSKFPERKKITLQTCPIAKGDELIMLVGRKIIAKDINDNFIDTYYSYPKIPKGKSYRKIEQARLQISGPSNIKSILSPENPDTREKSKTQRLSKSVEGISSAIELGVSKDSQFGKASSPEPIVELIDPEAPPFQKPALPELIVENIDLEADLPEEYSPQPILAEATIKTVNLQPMRTFTEMVPPGKSRQFASHYFMTLLNLQKDRKLTLVQQKSFGTIQITQIEPTYSSRKPR